MFNKPFSRKSYQSFEELSFGNFVIMGLYQRFLELYLKTRKDFKVYPLEKLKEPPKKFLVFSITALGDTLFSIPAIKSLKLSFPNSELIAVINHKWVPLFESFPYIDKLYNFKKGILNIFSLGRNLREENAKVALIFHGNYPEDILLCMLSEVNFILKSRLNSKYINYLSFKDFDVNTHAIETRLALVKAIGGKKITKEMELEPLLDLSIKEKINTSFSILSSESRVIGFQLGASYMAKTWPIEHFVQLAKNLSIRGNYFFVLIGSKNEKKLGKIFERFYPYKNFLNFIGKTSLKELPYLLKKLDVLITPDTGILHLAIALKVPTVSLFALTNPIYNGPYQDLELHKVISRSEGLKYSHLKKKKRPQTPMESISPQEVLKQIEEVLKIKK
ncbi:glycosyltransferase family 9 protein [Thermodesulfatator autotrophicus]|uniref:Glycosyl transferase family 9 n=1 Tax=Thermodesulfatator autotrophicus TaxID=1795632 RepID=A0A177E9K8_9BACT|nr:glycosyltransferase family 9 protein [Thermodesulfatator autotrophicus]OAG27679.1 hypothetical protein TH606_05640 [Thermodesulfatator autotrophicus]